MNDNAPPVGACEQYQGELVELALGILSGRERAAALDHLDTCSRCAAEVEELARTADQLLHVAPETEPPVGFEVRLFDRLGIKASKQRHLRLVGTRPQRALLLVAAAAVIAVAGFALGRSQVPTAPARPSAASGPRAVAYSATLLAAGGRSVVGEAYTFTGQPSWLLMTMDDGESTSLLTCELVMPDGHTLALGNFWLSKGYGSWAVRLPAAAANMRGVHVLHVVTAGGRVIATGTIDI
jgi:anti-sigma-K factor RskA